MLDKIILQLCIVKHGFLIMDILKLLHFNIELFNLLNIKYIFIVYKLSIFKHTISLIVF